MANNLLFDELRGKKIAIFGYGTEGKSILKYLLKKQIKNIIIYDEKRLTEEDNKFLIKSRIGATEGPFENNNYQDIEIAFRSPGVKKERLKYLLRKDALISSSTNLFFSLCRGKIIGVTGTKGKSTTVLLICSMLRRQKEKVFTGGNIGSPMLDFVDQTSNDSISILELSSFQLDDLEISPHIAVLLPIFVDHLDHHHGLKEYLQAKSAIVKNMTPDSIIITAFEDNNLKLVGGSQAEIYYFSESQVERGCHVSDSKVICKDNDERYEYEDILSLSKAYKIPLPNLLATATLALVLKIDFKPKEVLKHFKKMPFRIELTKDVGGVKYYNDSASTNPISTIAAMKTMTENFVLILGGSSKNLSYRLLAKEAIENNFLQGIYLLGETAPEIKQEFLKANFKGEISEKKDLADIVNTIFKLDHKNFTAVLFSPASASFDQFKNAYQRGEVFRHLVNSL